MATTNGNVNFQEGHSDVSASQQVNSTSNLGKDEVGWYFVEQFYTTLSRSPEKLHLFYGKRSQFVYGLETEVTDVSVGRQAIQERIKNLEFQDCKVRVTNVDSQASADNIVIQVIGELSNKSAEPKKFVQTFLLAQQPSGYFVLNDIMRYINEDVEEEQEAAPEAEAAPVVAEPETAAPVQVKTEPEPEAKKVEEPVKEAEPIDAAVVVQELEEVSPQESAPAMTEAAAEPAEPAVEAEKAPSKEDVAQPVPVDTEQVVKEVAEEDIKKTETPKAPISTPTVTRATAPAAAPAPAEPEKPKEPAKPMTWASRIAQAAGPPRAAVPLPKAATPAVQPQARQAAAPQQKSTTPAAAQPTDTASKDAGADEWQSVGADSKRQNRPVSISGAPAQGEKEGAMAYIKYVTEKVKTEELKGALAQYGELAYFDINRQKNCAFVEFKTQAGYDAAVAANPHMINGETIIVEQRRPKANAYGGSNYNSTRGGAPGGGGRGRGGFEGQQRTGSQGGPRGAYTGHARGGRGGAGAARGSARAGSQSANTSSS